MDIACETVFLKELQKNKAIILTKENTRSARDKKRVAWMNIQQVLLQTSGREYSVQQLCKKWNNLQQRVKEKIRNSGNDKMTKTLHERDLLCLQIIGPENLNLPPGPLDLNLSAELVNSLTFDQQHLAGDVMTDSDTELCPMVVSVSEPSMQEATFDNSKFLDVIIKNHTSSSSPKQQTDSQVLDLVMGNSELKNSLVTSLASLHNSLNLSNPSPLVQQPPTSSPHTADISLQEIDNIQTNIFTELANRISQINGGGGGATTESLRGGHTATTDHQQDHHHQYHPHDNHRFESPSTEVPNKKRKRGSPDATGDGEDAELIALKKEVLVLKKEKLNLKNEKTRLEIDALKRARTSGHHIGTQTQIIGHDHLPSGSSSETVIATGDHTTVHQGAL